eukprot:TRINITY_DN1626_c0_g4_i1.p1 TRINITY_DN1626_c0_g4~~TRINITY_DN1626_c0_g4_i1.p1  ORF type:complete len:521 (-),score=159.61 TRINITY_DN1626_c0_g4_i1:1296-2696(-)
MEFDNEPETPHVPKGITKKRPLKSRWEPPSKKRILPGMVIYMPSTIQGAAAHDFAETTQIEYLTRELATGFFDDHDESGRYRSPSPTPTYDKWGKRTNTRDVRYREKIELERHTLVQSVKERNPMFRPPPGYKPIIEKITNRLYIPVKKYPNYNFMGLIIGPRGKTQKSMERETGAKISIRGKGSVKEGKGRIGDASMQDDPHVLITGDTEEQVEAASRLVSALLIPVDESINEHKKNQLRELAALNGTLREDEFCRYCKSISHREWNCPERGGGQQWQPANIRCEVCGDASHPTRDCPMKIGGIRKEGVQQQFNEGQSANLNQNVDADYQSFMNELGLEAGGGGGGGSTTTTTSSSMGGGGGGSMGGGSAPPPWLQQRGPPQQQGGHQMPPPWMNQQQGGMGMGGGMGMQQGPPGMAPWQPQGGQGPPGQGQGQPWQGPPGQGPPGQQQGQQGQQGGWGGQQQQQ